MSVGSRCKVMIADDSEDIRSLLRLHLERDARFELIAEATNGQQAVDIATMKSPDIIILDISMPLLDGLQALALIKTGVPTTKVVMLSGLDDPDIRAQALASGAQAFFVKNMDLRVVVNAVADLCHGHGAA